jgi:hypothetical protein
MGESVRIPPPAAPRQSAAFWRWNRTKPACGLTRPKLPSYLPARRRLCVSITSCPATTFVMLKHNLRLPIELHEIGLELRSDSGQNAAAFWPHIAAEAVELPPQQWMKSSRTPPQPICVMPTTELGSWDVERRDDATVLVRVHSESRHGRPLPDAVFAFRYGDPQYDYWASQLFERMQAQWSQ